MSAKPTPLHPLRPSRRVFAAPACMKLRRLSRINAAVVRVGRIVILACGLVLVARMCSIGLVPV